MSKIRNHVGRLFGSRWFMPTLIGAYIALATFVLGAQMYSTSRASNPNPPIYRDVNGDGVGDKVVQRKVEKQGFLWSTYNTLEDEILFGVEINGKKVISSKRPI